MVDDNAEIILTMSQVKLQEATPAEPVFLK
jgi:hypothetical protein